MRTSLLAALVLCFGTAARAQNPAPPVAPAPPLEVGAQAPDFALRGATRYGTVREPVRLSDYHGKVVVLAYFFRARTRG